MTRPLCILAAALNLRGVAKHERSNAAAKLYGSLCWDHSFSNWAVPVS